VEGRRRRRPPPCREGGARGRHRASVPAPPSRPASRRKRSSTSYHLRRRRTRRPGRAAVAPPLHPCRRRPHRRHSLPPLGVARTAVTSIPTGTLVATVVPAAAVGAVTIFPAVTCANAVFATATIPIGPAVAGIHAVRASNAARIARPAVTAFRVGVGRIRIPCARVAAVATGAARVRPVAAATVTTGPAVPPFGPRWTRPAGVTRSGRPFITAPFRLLPFPATPLSSPSSPSPDILPLARRHRQHLRCPRGSRSPPTWSRYCHFLSVRSPPPRRASPRRPPTPQYHRRRPVHRRCSGDCCRRYCRRHRPSPVHSKRHPRRAHRSPRPCRRPPYFRARGCPNPHPALLPQAPHGCWSHGAPPRPPPPWTTAAVEPASASPAIPRRLSRLPPPGRPPSGPQ